MKNLDSILAAYLAGWAIFFVYYVSVAQRMNALHKQIEQLKSSLSRGK
jgi:CcmD family protein